MNFWTNIDTPLDFFAFFFAICVVFVNGSTDAPNAICSVVLTKRLSLFKASLLSGVFNLLGVIVSTIAIPTVAKSIFSFAIAPTPRQGAILCVSSFVCVVLFGIVSWLLGLPSSESHALIFSLAGASFCVFGSGATLFKDTFSIIVYMIFSIVVSYAITSMLFSILKKKRLPYSKLLIFSCASISFMHGAQDGQKFIGILLFLLGTGANTSFGTISTLAILVGTIMSISTLLGGRKIIKSMGEITNTLSLKDSFLSDSGAFIGMLICSLLGMPVSTGNIKSSTMLACGIKSGEIINKRATIRIFSASLVTLPVCFIIGFITAKILLLLPL